MRNQDPKTLKPVRSKSNMILTFKGLDCRIERNIDNGEEYLEVRIPVSDTPSKVPSALVDDHKLTDTQIEEVMATVEGMMAFNHMMGHRQL